MSLDRKYPMREVVTSWIDGSWVRPEGPALPVIDPATEEQIAVLYEAGEAETAAAVDAAHRAFREGRWSRTSAAHKRDVFRRIAALTGQHLEELAWLEARNTGLPFWYLHGAQIPRILRNFSFFSDTFSQSTENALVQDDDYLRFVAREPAGVAALISPFNAPLALASTKIAAALAFGNSCVLKTSEFAPLAVARFMEILAEAGVPAGVVNLVNGRGHVTGDALVRHERVRVVSFTGGTQTGQAIAGVAASRLKRIDLELGGKSANIITASADLERAIDGALTSIFANNGQQCFAGSRILVDRKIADRFIDEFAARARRVRVGRPLDAGTEVGPLANAAQHKRVQSYVDIALGQGATLLAGGRRPAGLDKGYFFEPTVVLAQSNSDRVCQEEIFGPFAALQIYDDFDEALSIANDSDYGLVAYLWSNDLQQSLHAARALEAGTVLVNTPMNLDLRFPFGGYKNSGLGREGLEGFRHFYSEEKTVTVALKPPAVRRLGMDS